MAKRDYYEVLGVGKSTPQEAIKKAYRKSALKHHPDRNKGDKAAEEKFKEASEAYHVLSDKERRQNYDQFGHAAFDGAGGRGGFANSDFTSTFSDIFGSDIFGENTIFHFFEFEKYFPKRKGMREPDLPRKRWRRGNISIT